jgi:stromal membrane-associated protein
MSRRSNSTCADCTALDPTWASTNLGIFLCTQCSGCHRSLGTHISAVLSCQLDEWKPDQVSFMEHMGNEMANSFWEHHVPSEWPKPSDKEPRNYRELYIKAKYADRAFVYRLRKAPIIKQPPVSDPELDMETTTSKPTQVGMTEYSGFLNITLNRGKNLLPMKIMGQKHNKYMVIFRVGSQEVRSRRVKSDTCPEWNESLMLCWDGEMPLSIHVYGGREHVGQADVDLKQLLLGTDGRTLPNAQMSAATVTEALNEGEEEEEGEDAEDGDTEDVGSPAITSDVDEQCDATSQQGSIHRQISKRRSSTGSVASNASEMTACAAEESEQPDSQPTVPETFVPLTNRDTGLWSPKKGSSTPGSSSDKDGKRDSYGKVRLKMHHLGRGSAIIGHRPAQGGICIQVSFTKIDH